MKKITILLILISFSVFSQQKISQLPAASALTGVELLPIVQGGSTVRSTVQDFSNFSAALYVPLTRSLTINGTSFNLSANRTWTVGDIFSTSSYSNPSWITALAYSKITGVPSFITLSSLSATSPLFYNSSTGVFTIQPASTSQAGALSSTDWNTFNNKLSTASASTLYVPYSGANSFTTSNNITANAVTINTLNFNYVTGTTLGGLSKVSGDGITFTNNNTGDFAFTVRNGTWKLQCYQDTALNNENAQLGVNKGAMNLYSAGGAHMVWASNGNISAAANFTPHAAFELKAGTTTWAPMKFISGPLVTNTTNILAGNVQFLTDKLYFNITTGLAQKEFAFFDIAGTSGRVPFETTNGRLTDDAGLTYNTTSGLSTPSLNATTAATLPASFTAGTVALTSGITGTISTLADNVFALNFFSATGSNPADATTYYLGNIGNPYIAASVGSVKLPYNCTLIAANINNNNTGGNGTTESVTVAVNGTTNYTLSSSYQYTSNAQQSVTGISQNFNANDLVNIKIITPTWATNPLGCYTGVMLWFVRRQ